MREATLLYGIGAGIAAAAGTRLALKLILTERCILLSFQVQDIDALDCYILYMGALLG